MAARPVSEKVNVGMGPVGLRTSDGGMARVEELREKIGGCIGWLIGGMGGERKKAGHDITEWGIQESVGVDKLLLNALGEIVRGIERGSMPGYS
jgi:hypothetical protein